MKPIKTLINVFMVLIFCLAFPKNVLAQNEDTTDKSIIVMTQSELNSFLTTIAEARRAQLKERETTTREQDLSQLRLKYNGNSQNAMRSNTMSDDQIFREFRYLNEQIYALRSNNTLPMPATRGDNSTIIMPGSSNPTSPVYPQTGMNTTKIVPTKNNSKIMKLQNELDSLKNIEKNKPVVKQTSLADSLSNLKTTLKSLTQQMSNLEQKMLDSEKKSDKKETPKSENTFFKEKVYFENNSETLQDSYEDKVIELTEILKKYPETKIVLEGWASPLGSANYNKQLSMRRAEAVKQAFVDKGVAKNRILTSFKGEDKTSSEQHARRVEMSVMVP